LKPGKPNVNARLGDGWLMITTPTVFILGAGASLPYKFPSGTELADLICKSDPSIYNPFGIDHRTASAFINELKRSDQMAVDAFLEHRQEFVDVGKTAIALFLIGRENEPNLFPEPGQRDWYTYLVDRLTVDTAFDNVAKNQVGFITFNYERSLEHYLSLTICSRYGKRLDEVGQVLRSLPFIHVHGQLGYLPWQDTGPGVRAYNTDRTKKEIDVAVKGIKIISESIDDSPEFAKARDLMKNAQRIAILGFGYHPVNMRRLQVPFKPGGVTIWGTCYGKTMTERDELIRKYDGLSLVSPDTKILEFLRSVQRFQPD
jgi:hypothetical protein